jgi:hypothetical protein
MNDGLISEILGMKKQVEDELIRTTMQPNWLIGSLHNGFRADFPSVNEECGQVNLI